MPDQEQHDRYERWLADLAAHLDDKGVSCALGFGDRHMGDIMYLGIWSDAGYVEITVVRGKRQKASAILSSETVEAARDLANTLRGAHRDVRRIRNAKRSFWHLVERMAERLVVSFEPWAKDYPQQALERLQEVIPEARRMIGTVAHRHVKTKGGRDGVQYGVSIPMGEERGAGPPRRALRYNEARGAFEGYGDALRAVRSRAERAGVDLGDIVVAGAAASVILGAGTLDIGEDIEERKQSWWDSCDCSLEALDCGLESWDCAATVGDIGCEVPDCDVFDVPDCACDLGI